MYSASLNILSSFIFLFPGGNRNVVKWQLKHLTRSLRVVSKNNNFAVGEEFLTD